MVLQSILKKSHGAMEPLMGNKIRNGLAIKIKEGPKDCHGRRVPTVRWEEKHDDPIHQERLSHVVTYREGVDLHGSLEYRQFGMSPPDALVAKSEPTWFDSPIRRKMMPPPPKSVVSEICHPVLAMLCQPPKPAESHTGSHTGSHSGVMEMLVETPEETLMSLVHHPAWDMICNTPDQSQSDGSSCPKSPTSV